MNRFITSDHVLTAFSGARFPILNKTILFLRHQQLQTKITSLFSFKFFFNMLSVINCLYASQNNYQGFNQVGFKAAHSTQTHTNTTLTAVTEKLHGAPAWLSPVLMLLKLLVVSSNGSPAAAHPLLHTLMFLLRSLQVC